MNKKEPLFHVVKRDEMPWYRTWLIRIIAVLLALVVCSVVTMLLTGQNPLEVFEAIVYGGFGSPRKTWILLQNLAILLCVSVGLAPAFRMRFWNIGGEGQILMGCFGAASCMILLGGKIPNALLILLMVVVSVLAGALWGFIPAFFKAKWGTNETLFTLMMNYVAIQLVSYYTIVWEVPKGSGKIGIINQQTMAGWFPSIGGNKYLLNVLIVAAITAFMYVYLKYNKHGYEIAVVGESQNTARYIGINVERVIMRTMALSGAVCGTAGLLLVAGTDHTLTTTISANRGFTAVLVAWLGKFNPLWMILASFIIVFLSRGASQISTSFGLNESFGDIITGIIIFFIIGSEFFIRYKVCFRGRGTEKIERKKSAADARNEDRDRKSEENDRWKSKDGEEPASPDPQPAAEESSKEDTRKAPEGQKEDR